MLVNYSIRFQGRSNTFFTESVSMTVEPSDLGYVEVNTENRRLVEAELLQAAVTGCLNAAIAAGALKRNVAEHRLEPFASRVAKRRRELVRDEKDEAKVE